MLFIAPAIGPIAAVALELPDAGRQLVWRRERWLQRWPLPDRASRLGMGIVAFLLLMGARDWPWADGASANPGVQLAYGLMKPAGMHGLAGQIGFGLIPLIRR